jgi:hypothetical protein
MSVRKKGRRRLVVADRVFIWWVCESEPDCWVGEVLTVASEDGHFFVRFYLGQEPERRFLVVQGSEFAGLPDAGRYWIRVECPEWQSGPGIQPSDVRKLIDWSFSPDQPRFRVDYRGQPLSVSSAARTVATPDYPRLGGLVVRLSEKKQTGSRPKTIREASYTARGDAFPLWDWLQYSKVFKAKLCRRAGRTWNRIDGIGFIIWMSDAALVGSRTTPPTWEIRLEALARLNPAGEARWQEICQGVERFFQQVGCESVENSV